MSVRNQLKLLVGGLSARREGGSNPGFHAPHSPTREFLDRSRLVAALIFLFTVTTIVLISWAGMTTSHLSVLPNQVATVRVTSSAAFTYESAEKTRVARAQFIDRVPPVYRLETEPLRRFEEAARILLAQLEGSDAARAPVIGPPAIGPTGAMVTAPAVNFTTLLATRRAEFTGIAQAFNLRGPYHATAEDVAALLGVGDAKARAAVFENGFATLRDIYAQGVADSSLAGTGPGRAVVFQIAHPDGATAPRSVQNMEDALTLLRVSLAADSIPRPAAQAVFRIFRFGLVPNVVFDTAATQASLAAVTRDIKPVKVSVVSGQSIIEPGDRVSQEQYEMFQAHRQYLMEHGDAELNEGLTLFGRVLLVLAMVLASLIYIRIEDPETLRSNVRCGLLALVVIINLTLIRANYSLGGAEFFMRDGSWASTLPYVAPTAFAPLIVAILIDAGSGIFMALLISIFTGVIYGNRLDLLVLTFLASLVAIYMARDARRRGRVVRAAGAGGLTVAAFAALIGIADQTPADTLARQMTAGLATGLLTGIAVVGLLPVLESLFKRTTDITLLELTDYNHPLLRRMQLESPGTYHHSLVVAQLSENACNAIGANPLIARVCALFHDVGKIGNAAFFAENQRDGVNPHDSLPPAESAQIIKRHVTDGVELAVKNNLPRAVIDVIRQHHGTSLVRYFYERAVEQTRAPFAKKPQATKATPRLEELPPAGIPAAVDEPAFRYDGPTPQFKESAVISLADGVEAASRSLRTATPETLRDLIDRIVRDRINDGQLDSAPLTFEEITKVKNSFQFTLLNMLHARVAYPVATVEPAPGIAVKA